METQNSKQFLFFLFLAICSSSIFVFVVSQDVEEDRTFFCSEAYCTEVKRLKPCPAKRNCSTIGFRTFLDPSSCNCCDYCFDYLKENATCTPVSNQKPLELCGPYLECQPGASDADPATCKSIEIGPTKVNPDPNFCMTKRKEYLDGKLKGTLGIAQFMPECDSGGNYAPRQCIPGSICYCSNSTGGKIFGQSLTEENQDCACARDVARLQQFGFKGRMPHCLPNGDYDELQCVVRSCYCRSLPDKIYQPQNMTRLACFNKTIHVYDPEETSFYMRDCESKKAKAEIEIAEAELKGILMVISSTPNCDPDGNYAPIQTRFDKQFCSDPMSGEVLESFEVGKFSPEAAVMNCNCARARYILRESATGKPQCCKNGNYRALQHIGSTWFCVDAYGRQDVSKSPIEVNEDKIDTLPCYSNSVNLNDFKATDLGCLP